MQSSLTHKDLIFFKFTANCSIHSVCQNRCTYNHGFDTGCVKLQSISLVEKIILDLSSSIFEKNAHARSAIQSLKNIRMETYEYHLKLKLLDLDKFSHMKYSTFNFHVTFWISQGKIIHSYFISFFMVSFILISKERESRRMVIL